MRRGGGKISGLAEDSPTVGVFSGEGGKKSLASETSRRLPKWQDHLAVTGHVAVSRSDALFLLTR